MENDRPSLRRPRWVAPAAMALCLILAVVATWVIAQRFVSPAQIAAEAEAPPAGPILAPVRQGALRDSFTTTATWIPAQQEKIPVTSPEGGVITAHTARPGDAVGAGTVLLEVNGRPVIATRGDFPLYRDLTYATQGPDVRQWQDLLQGLGYGIGSDRTGRFEQGTLRATRSFYKDRGYRVETSPVDAAPSEDGPARAPHSPPESESGSTTGPSSGASEASSEGPTRDGSSDSLDGAVIVPLSEVLYVPHDDLRVDSVPEVGARLSEESAISLASEKKQLIATVPALEAVSLEEGTAAIVTDTASEQQTEATLGTIPPPATPKDSGEVPDVQVPVKAPDQLQPTADATFTVEIIRQNIAEGALIIPTHAVAERGAGKVVYVAQSDGSFTEVQVEVLGSARGETAVKPSTGGLTVESQVRVQ